MRASPFFFASLSACAAFALAPSARADDESAAELANRGLHTQLGPVLLLGEDGGVGGGLDFALRYGIEVGPVILAPGGRAAGYFFSDNGGHFIGDVMPTLRVTLPFGPFAPFAEAGIGPGVVTNDTQGGVALMGGVGLMIHFGRVFAIGGEVSEEAITNTGFHTLAIGPAIQFGL